MLVIGRYDRTVKGTVNTSCLCKGTERVMCARRCLAFRRVTCFFFFFMKMYRRCLVSLSNVVIVLIKWPIDVDPGAIG